MTKNQNQISIIVPCKNINNYIKKDLIPALKKQTHKDFELIIIPDKLCKKGPANKRDLGVKKAKGKIIAFIDDDAYPDKNWLKNAVKHFNNKNITAVCGPGITPPTNNLRQQVSASVWQTWLGAGPAGTYRCQPKAKREVDDFPTFNLIVRKKDFKKVGCFDSYFWPGEDTKLCHDLVYKLKKKIIYDPKVFVYHHRREIFIPHLKQIARFGLHRGHFARILPKTSARIGYFLPSLFLFYLIFISILLFYSVRDRGSSRINFLYLFPINIYFLLLLITSIFVYCKKRNLKLSFLLIPAIIATHLVYGFMFIGGLFSRKLKQ